MQIMLKIAIIGPESTGKTALCQELAAHFQCDWEPELARAYVENLDRPYEYEDVVQIAKKQIEQENKYNDEKSAGKIVIFDTDLIITKVWFEFKYNKVPDFVTERLNSKFFDFYLLLKPDLPWEFDPVREHGDNREYFFDWYENEILKLGTPYAKIGGVGVNRFQNALREINSLLLAENI